METPFSKPGFCFFLFGWVEVFLRGAADMAEWYWNTLRKKGNRAQATADYADLRPIIYPLHQWPHNAAGKILKQSAVYFCFGNGIHATARFCRAKPSLAPVLIVSASSQYPLAQASRVSGVNSSLRHLFIVHSRASQKTSYCSSVRW